MDSLPLSYVDEVLISQETHLHDLLQGYLYFILVHKLVTLIIYNNIYDS
jgi:hypothetical protein